jgi:Domain of unknown function (DUF4331)
MKKLLSIVTVAVAVMSLMVGVAPLVSRGADHLDGPLAEADGRMDITDVYAFQSPANSHNTVLIMNVDPAAGVLSPTSFRSTAAYEIRVIRHGQGDQLSTTDDAESNTLVYRVTFSAPNASGKQRLTLRCAPRGQCLDKKDLATDAPTVDQAKDPSDNVADNPQDGASVILAQGWTGSNISVRGGGRIRAGLFDDPFFFDLAAFRNNLQFCPGGVGTDFFLGLNVSSIVLEVPTSTLGRNLGIWGRTTLSGNQVDRMGRPAINTVFNNHNDPGKDLFNVGRPRNDRRDYRAQFITVLEALGNDATRAGQLADFLLPDVLTYDTSQPAGFPNGRRLQDDVIDIELGLLTNGAVTTDCVANDSTFRSSFPYLGTANP